MVPSLFAEYSPPFSEPEIHGKDSFQLGNSTMQLLGNDRSESHFQSLSPKPELIHCQSIRNNTPLKAHIISNFLPTSPLSPAVASSPVCSCVQGIDKDSSKLYQLNNSIEVPPGSSSGLSNSFMRRSACSHRNCCGGVHICDSDDKKCSAFTSYVTTPGTLVAHISDTRGSCSVTPPPILSQARDVEGDITINGDSSDSGAEGCADMVESSVVVRQMFVPYTGWATQMADGAIWIRYNDGTQLGMHCHQAQLVSVDQDGNICRQVV